MGDLSFPTTPLDLILCQQTHFHIENLIGSYVHRLQVDTKLSKIQATLSELGSILDPSMDPF